MTRIIKVTALISLVLGVASVVAWIHSFFYSYRYWVMHVDSRIETLVFASNDGYLKIRHSDTLEPIYRGRHEFEASEVKFVRWLPRYQERPLVKIRNITIPPSQLLILPYWVLVVAFGSLPACWFSWHYRNARVVRRRAKRGLCVSCGYDLRGCDHVCPECGSCAANTAPGGLRNGSGRL